MVVGICSTLDTICYNISYGCYGFSFSFYKSFILMKNLRPEVTNHVCKEINELFQMFDLIYISALNITPDELDILVEKMSEEELEMWANLILTKLPFTKRKQILNLRNKHINYFYEKNI